MSISEAVAIEKRFAALEEEIAKLRQEITVLKCRLVYSDESQPMGKRMKAVAAAMPLVHEKVEAPNAS